MEEQALFLEYLAHMEDDLNYLSKRALEEADEPMEPSNADRCNRPRESAWTRKRSYRKKLVRRFLAQNPAMDLSQLRGTKCNSGIYIDCPFVWDESDLGCDMMSYSFNPFTKTFCSERGDIRKYHGRISIATSSCFFAMGQNNLPAKLTNKRIRQMPLNDCAARFSYYKKAYGSWIDNTW